MDIVLLTAKARCGKDTAAKVFVDAGYTQFSFADPIRKFIMDVCGFKDLEELDLKKMIPQEVLDGKTPRYAMQTLGTEWGRESINEKIWTSAVREKITRSGAEKIVVSDCRFDNEYEDMLEFFPSSKLRLIEIIRPKHADSLTTDAANHKSESGLSSKFQREIVMNDGTLEEFLEKIANII